MIKNGIDPRDNDRMTERGHNYRVQLTRPNGGLVADLVVLSQMEKAITK